MTCHLCVHAPNYSINQPYLVTGDIEDSEVRAKLIDGTIEHFGQLDILCSNAGWMKIGGTGQTEVDELRTMLEVSSQQSLGSRTYFRRKLKGMLRSSKHMFHSGLPGTRRGTFRSVQTGDPRAHQEQGKHHHDFVYLRLDRVPVDASLLRGQGWNRQFDEKFSRRTGFPGSARQQCQVRKPVV